MYKKFYEILKWNDKVENYTLSSGGLNLILLILLLALTSAKPIVFLYWLAFKIFSVLIISMMYFTLLSKVKSGKIIGEEINSINYEIKDMSNCFIIMCCFSSTMLLATILYITIGSIRFKISDFVKNIKIKTENFNDYISNKISNKFSIKEEPDILKESYRD
jgi:hypothetical protein